ncbi:hypothetical protein LZC95_41855 [Pendulispora brunnea]|uniref:Holliday junction DNA helicase RuvA C-terminal domain-containing protein n=1 Tax=Pendulispora brunnea TaxID=2905690 RepID=A0ABZ2K2N9_9BACT
MSACNRFTTTLLLLREHLTEENHEVLLQAAKGKTKRQVQELIAALSPQPDAPTLIRAMPNASAPAATSVSPMEKTARVERRHNALSAERDFGREHIERKRAEKKMDPRQRGPERGSALRALLSMGFKERQARHALATIEARWGGLPPPLEAVVREALSVLT